MAVKVSLHGIKGLYTTESSRSVPDNEHDMNLCTLCASTLFPGISSNGAYQVGHSWYTTLDQLVRVFLSYTTAVARAQVPKLTLGSYKTISMPCVSYSRSSYKAYL